MYKLRTLIYPSVNPSSAIYYLCGLEEIIFLLQISDDLPVKKEKYIFLSVNCELLFCELSFFIITHFLYFISFFVFIFISIFHILYSFFT